MKQIVTLFALAGILTCCGGLVDEGTLSDATVASSCAVPPSAVVDTATTDSAPEAEATEASTDCPAELPPGGAVCTMVIGTCGYFTPVCGLSFATCVSGKWDVSLGPECRDASKD